MILNMIDYLNPYLYLIILSILTLIILLRLIIKKYKCIGCCKCVKRDEPILNLDNDTQENVLLNDNNTIFDRL